jgi:hypothetical protein
VKDGRTSKPEIIHLLKDARTATEQSKLTQDVNDVSEEEIASLLQQLESEPEKVPEHSFNNDKEPSISHEGGNIDKLNADETDEIASILAQLADAAHLEQRFQDPESDSAFPSVSGLSFPSVPKGSESADDDLSARLANLKTFQPKTYTGTDRGSINVFVPGIAKAEEDETIHWCGIYPLFFI